MTEQELIAFGADIGNRFNAMLKRRKYRDADVTTGSALFAHDGVASAARQLTRLELLKPRLLVEIGTGKGVTTAMLARIAQRVVTIDIGTYRLRRDILDWAGADNVAQVVVPRNEDKARLLAMLDFDVAFVDGDHSEQGCEFDFLHTKRCGRVLFHDFTPPYENGVKSVVEAQAELQVIKDYPFAWWLENDTEYAMLEAVGNA